MKFKNVIKNDLNALINFKFILTVSIVFIIFSYHGIKTLNISSEQKNIWDLFLLTFSGTTIDNSSFMDVIKSFFPNVLFLFFIGNFFYNECTQRYTYSLIRTQSIIKWFISKIISIVIFSCIFWIIGYLTIFIVGVSNKLNIDSSWSQLSIKLFFGNVQTIYSIKYVVISMFLLSMLSLVFFSMILFLLNLIIRETIYSYISICLILIEPHLGNFVPNNILKYFIGEQSLILRHNLFDSNFSDFTILWSINYLIIMSIIIFFINSRILRTRSF